MPSTSLKYKDIAQKRLASYKLSQPDLFSLSLLASLARRIEPELLRSLRLNLAHYFDEKKRPTVGTESALWFSSLIESRGSESVTLLPGVLEILRQRLKAQENLLEEVYSITKRLHQNVPPIISWEEELIYIGLSSKFTEEERAERIYKTTLEAVKAVKSGNRHSLEEMVIDISQRVPTTVVSQESFIKLLSLSQTRLVQYKASSIRSDRQLSIPTISLLIKRHKNYLEIGEAIEEADFKITIPNIQPLTIHIVIPQGSKHTCLVPQNRSATIPVPAEQNVVFIHTLDGDVYTLDFSDLLSQDEENSAEIPASSDFPKSDYNFPQSLIEAFKRGQVVPFVGAGVSASIKSFESVSIPDKGEIIHSESIFPSWKVFLDKAADKLDREKLSSKADVVRSLLNDYPPDYLESAQRAFDGLGQKQWYQLLSENFDIDIKSANEDSFKLAKLIWQLGSNLVLTTNFDMVLQAVHEKPHLVRILDTQASEFAEIQRNWQLTHPTVVHLHGHIHNKADVLLTREQYKAFYNPHNNRAKLDIFRNLFTQRTILFIGFGINDSFILRELERANLIYESGANHFYALVHEAEKDDPNIPNYVQKITFSDFDKPLMNLLEELISIVKDRAEREPEVDKEKSRIKKSFFNVPYRSKGAEFIGRRGKLEEIWQTLSQEGSAAIGQAVSVRGFGGLGKTQLAVEYAHKYRDNYKNGVFWLAANENIDNQLLHIADREGWINQFDLSVNQIDVAKAKFRELSECLIIFDNVESQDDIKPYLPKTDLRTHILITSRGKQLSFRQIDLELLERNESRELLLKISNRRPQDNAEKEHFENIIEILSDIPLAIELVGGYLAEHEPVTFAKYHQFLNEVPLERLEREFPEGSFTDHDRSIIQTLRISEETIREKPLMVEILKVLAWSGSSSMGTSLLEALIKPESNFEFETALGDAYRLRLLKKDDTDRFAIHRLLAKVIRGEQPLNYQNEWHQKIANNLKNWFDQRKDEFIYLTEFEAEIEHLHQWRSHSSVSNLNLAVWLITLESYPSRHRGNYQKSLEFLTNAFELYQTEKLNNIELLANIQNDSGVLFGKLGSYQEALKYQLEALKIRRGLFGNDHPYTAISLSNVGLSYGDLGKHHEALKYQLQALEIQRKLFGESHPGVALSLSNLGWTYKNLGKFEEAIDYQRKAISIGLNLFGSKHPNTANSFRMLGETFNDLGNYEEALKYQQQALKIQQELLGVKHPDVAVSLNSLGNTYTGLGNDKKAIEFLEQALMIFKELLGEKHPHTITTCSNLINVWLKTGRIEKAGKLAGEFLSYIPQNHPQRKTFEKYGLVYHKSLKKKRQRR